MKPHGGRAARKKAKKIEFKPKIIVSGRVRLYNAYMRNNKTEFIGADFSRRNFLRLAAFTPVLAAGLSFGVARAEGAKGQALAADCEIVVVPSLGFVKPPSEPVALPAKAEEYLRYGNLATRRMLAAKAVHPDEDLVKACVRDWPAFADRVREDARLMHSPTAGKDFAARLGPYAVIGLSVKLTAEKIRYDYGVGALAGNDDLNGDGLGDGLDAGMLAKAGKSEVGVLANPERLRERFAARARKLDLMPLDDIYSYGSGVCRHQTMVAMAVFLALKEGAPKLANLYLSGLASDVDRHQWLMAAAVAPEKIVFAFYDPTASSGERARSVRSFTDRSGERRYMGIPSEIELRDELGLP